MKRRTYVLYDPAESICFPCQIYYSECLQYMQYRPSLSLFRFRLERILADVPVQHGGGVLLHGGQLAEALLVDEADLVAVRIGQNDDAHRRLAGRVQRDQRRQHGGAGFADAFVDQRLDGQRHGEGDATVGGAAIDRIGCGGCVRTTSMVMLYFVKMYSMYSTKSRTYIKILILYCFFSSAF